jgi:hypothetical protein
MTWCIVFIISGYETFKRMVSAFRRCSGRRLSVRGLFLKLQHFLSKLWLGSLTKLHYWLLGVAPIQYAGQAIIRTTINLWIRRLKAASMKHGTIVWNTLFYRLRTNRAASPERLAELPLAGAKHVSDPTFPATITKIYFVAMSCYLNRDWLWNHRFIILSHSQGLSHQQEFFLQELYT